MGVGGWDDTFRATGRSVRGVSARHLPLSVFSMLLLGFASTVRRFLSRPQRHVFLLSLPPSPSRSLFHVARQRDVRGGARRDVITQQCKHRRARGSNFPPSTTHSRVSATHHRLFFWFCFVFLNNCSEVLRVKLETKLHKLCTCKENPT